jgi:hypothetical protein
VAPGRGWVIVEIVPESTSNPSDTIIGHAAEHGVKELQKIFCVQVKENFINNKSPESTKLQV